MVIKQFQLIELTVETAILIARDEGCRGRIVNQGLRLDIINGMMTVTLPTEDMLKSVGHKIEFYRRVWPLISCFRE